MTLAVIVQARMGSSRLPGKVLQPLGRRTALAVCLDRCARIPGVDVVVCAVPQSSRDDPVAEEAARHGHAVARGPEDDVLARYALAAKAVEADIVMRVTSDCPVIDPDVCAAVIDLHARTGADYACNNIPPRFPHGLDCEVFAANRLYEADWLARDAHDREHVTPWLRRETGYARAALTGPGAGMERLRWTLDHPEDLDFFQGLAATLGDNIDTAGWAEIAAVCLRRPDLVARNAGQVDESRFTALGAVDIAVNAPAGLMPKAA